MGLFFFEQAMNGLGNRVYYEFGAFRADTLKRQLYRGTEPLPLTAKAFDTLAVLLAEHGEIVSKMVLMASVWGETVVEENNLTQQISAIRKALGERAGEHRYIVTVPGRGYCFVAPVRESPTELPEERSSTLPPDAGQNVVSVSRVSRFDKASVFGGGLGLAYVFLVCAAVFLPGLRAGDDTRPRAIAVLNFTALNTADDSLGVGLRDTLRARLGSVEDITVRPAPAEPGGDVLDAGRRMHADVVLAGTVQRVEGRLRVAVELVDVDGERVVWGKTFDESVTNVFGLQDVVTTEVIDALRSSRPSARRLGLRGTNYVPAFRRLETPAGRTAGVVVI